LVEGNMEQTIKILERLKAKLERCADISRDLAKETPGIEGILCDGRTQGYRSAILAVKDEITSLQEG